MLFRRRRCAPQSPRTRPPPPPLSVHKESLPLPLPLSPLNRRPVHTDHHTLKITRGIYDRSSEPKKKYKSDKTSRTIRKTCNKADTQSLWTCGLNTRFKIQCRIHTTERGIACGKEFWLYLFMGVELGNETCIGLFCLFSTVSAKKTFDRRKHFL